MTGSPVSTRLALKASTRRLQTRTARLAYSDCHSHKHHQPSPCHHSHLDYSCKHYKPAGDRIVVASKDDRAFDAWQHNIRICTMVEKALCSTATPAESCVTPAHNARVTITASTAPQPRLTCCKAFQTHISPDHLRCIPRPQCDVVARPGDRKTGTRNLQPWTLAAPSAGLASMWALLDV